MAVSLDHFVENLILSGLMSVDELAAFRESLPPDRQPQRAEDLVRELVLAERLTLFQAEKVCQGRIRGLVFDEYTVLDRLGTGGMGQVFKAEHHTMGRLVALKMLPPAMMDSPEAVRRFHREVRAAARLLHPNIVTAFDAREHDGICCLVMEYVDGQDLASLVKEEGPLRTAAAVDCILQAARGLHYAHGEGVVHRDIKPSNLLVDKRGTVKILDLGTARIFDECEDAADRLSQSDPVLGTCDYMAPEMADDAAATDRRADIYSLGCTLFRLLTGDPPFPRGSTIEILLAHREAPIPSLSDERGDVSDGLDAACRKMLAKNPNDRQQSMGEVIEALEQAMAVYGIPQGGKGLGMRG
jgi:serine/threonine protein kinase